MPPRDDLPVAAEEDVEDHADDRQEQQDEQPRERDRRLAVVHDQHDDQDEPVDVEDHAQPCRQEREEDGHAGTLSDEGGRCHAPLAGDAARLTRGARAAGRAAHVGVRDRTRYVRSRGSRRQGRGTGRTRDAQLAHDPVHLFVGLYETGEAAERDFDNVVALHRQGLVAAFDAALIVRGEDGTLRVEHKKRSGPSHPDRARRRRAPHRAHAVRRHPVRPDRRRHRRAGPARGGQPAEEGCGGARGVAGTGSEAALAVVSNKTDTGRLEQMLPGASQRIAKVLDVEHDGLRRGARARRWTRSEDGPGGALRRPARQLRPPAAVRA